jgi:aspartate/methionine/tyrosine aminotransferase
MQPITMPPDNPVPATTVFERISSLARSMNAINLGQGFPDMPEPEALIGAAQRALSAKPNQYPPMRGLAELRASIVAYYAAAQNLAIDPEQIVVTSGATEALAAAILALVRPGDEVVLLQPLYDCYLPLVERAGGRAVLVDLDMPCGALMMASIAAAIGPATRVLVLNTPNNPLGTAFDRGTLEQIGRLCEVHDVTVIADEVWEAMLFDQTHVSALCIPSLRDRTVKIGSAGKIFSLTGWKIGWAIAAPSLAARIAAQHQYLTFTTATPLQWAVADGLLLPAAWHADHRARYVSARQRLVSGLEAAGYRILPNAGTWFVIVDLAGSGLPPDDEAIAEAMIHTAGVAAIPVSAFYAARPQTGYLRLCFAKDDSMLDEAIARLTAFRKRYL